LGMIQDSRFKIQREGPGPIRVCHPLNLES
jgi:hypothetical protein